MESKSPLALWMAAIRTSANAGTITDAIKFASSTQRPQRLQLEVVNSASASSAAGEFLFLYSRLFIRIIFATLGK